jgi:6-phosphogluconolactonase
MAQPVSASPRVVADADALAVAAAEVVAGHAAHALAARGAFRLAVPGGRSPRGMLAVLAASPHREALDWSRVTVLFADERAVPPGDPESNYRLVREALLDPLGERAPRVVRMPADRADLDEAAREYEAEVAEPLDLLVLGVGEDGHVASLFPGSALLAERVRRVAAVTDSPRPPARRLTLTPRALAEARALLVLAGGAAKADAVAAALAGAADPLRVPAALARAGEWLVDREAASQLRGARPE